MSDHQVFRIIPAEAGMLPIVLYQDNTWAVLGRGANGTGILPPRFARAPDGQLARCIAGKRYSKLTDEERRIYNRLRKRASDAKLVDAPEVQARRQASRRTSMRAFYERLREEGRLHEYYQEQAAKNRLRRAARRQQGP